MAKTGKTITVEQIGSPIRRPAIQRQTLIAAARSKTRLRFAAWSTKSAISFASSKRVEFRRLALWDRSYETE